LKAPAREARVLFVDDVGDFRIALVAFARSNPQPDFWPQAAVWLAARKGAGVQELSSPSAIRSDSDGLEPSASVTVDDPAVPGAVAHVAIASQGCGFETAAWPAVNDWTSEPTGSYLARTQRTLRPEWWRITCGGQTREMVPGPGSLAPRGMTKSELDAALSRARGKTVDGQQLRDAVSATAQEWGYAAAGLPAVVWTGRTAGTTPANGVSYDGAVTVLAAPAAGGGWVGEAVVSYDHADAGNSRGNSVGFSIRTDPTDPSTVFAIPLSEDILVITPVLATAVRAVRDGRVVANARVTGAAAVLKVPAVDGLVVQAVDRQGEVIATGPVADQTGPLREENHWDQG
jgi:hypothetical protein